MNEMYSCFRDTAAVLNTDIHGCEMTVNAEAETRSRSRRCLRTVNISTLFGSQGGDVAWYLEENIKDYHEMFLDQKKFRNAQVLSKK